MPPPELVRTPVSAGAIFENWILTGKSARSRPSRNPMRRQQSAKAAFLFGMRFSSNLCTA